MDQNSFIRPIRRHVLLLDDQRETKDGDVVVRRELGCDHMDFSVVRVGTDEKCGFGQGDKVVVSDPNKGRRVRLDGIVYRVVRVSDVIAVVE